MKRRFLFCCLFNLFAILYLLEPMQNKTKLTTNYLTQIPFRKVAEFNEEEGLITLLIPKFRNAWFRKWLIPKRKSSYFRIHLDPVGSQVWLSIDGNRPVQEICEILAQYIAVQDLPSNQVEERATAYLTDLARKGFIGFNEAQPQLNG